MYLHELEDHERNRPRPVESVRMLHVKLVPPDKEARVGEPAAMPAVAVCITLEDQTFDVRGDLLSGKLKEIDSLDGGYLDHGFPFN